MKYKVGDRVRIKTWDQLVEEFNISSVDNRIMCPFDYTSRMEHDLTSISPNRVITIKEVMYENSYHMKEIKWRWSDHVIDCLYSDHYKMFDSIESRFKLMDFE